MKNFMDRIKDYDDIVIFGYSNVGKDIYNIIMEVKDKRVLFCDNSRKKWGRHDKFEVFPVEDAIRIQTDALFIIASIYHEADMKHQLEQLGVLSENIIFDLPKGILDLKEKNDEMCRRTPKKKLQFEVNMVSHCNLNCKYCTQFSPLAEEKFIEIGSFANDFKRLSEIFNGVSGRIYLLGGEPLLHNKLDEYLFVARKYFPESDIGIVTNGVLIKSMKSDFWICCAKNNIKIIMTKYPIEMNYDEIEKILTEHGVKFEYFNNTDGSKYMYHYPLDLEGNQDIQENFAHCINANECIALRNGRLYTCSIAPSIGVFNKYFNKNLELIDEDGIDIYKANDGQQILEFLSKPIHFCRYCNVKERTYNHNWSCSNKNINEWI